MDITSLIDRNYLIKMRRYLHEHPGVSRDERAAGALVREELGKLGIPFFEIGPYGALGVLACAAEGPTIVLRADMDALPIQESTKNHKMEKTSVSRTSGVAHLCGHDAHTAMLLAAMHALKAVSSSLCGKVLFAFEADEETGTGVQPMIEALTPLRPVCAWGLHVNPMLKTSDIALSSGPRTAGGIFMEVNIRGKSAHGSTPYLGSDALLCAANIVTALENVVGRELPPAARASLSVGEFHSGTASNIIADLAHFMGTCRYFEPEVGARMEAAVRRIVRGVCTMYGCLEEFVNMRHILPVVNDAACTERAISALKTAGLNVIDSEPLMGSETFAHYGRLCPGVFALLGVGNEEKGTMGAPMHNPQFDLDEDALVSGAAATLAFAIDLLSV